MFSRIQDLPRFHNDLKRFNLALDSTHGEVKQQGTELLSKLLEAVNSFDQATGSLIVQSGDYRMDHAQAQQSVLEAKTAIEGWVVMNAPNVHVDTTAEFDK